MQRIFLRSVFFGAAACTGLLAVLAVVYGSQWKPGGAARVGLFFGLLSMGAFRAGLRVSNSVETNKALFDGLQTLAEHYRVNQLQRLQGAPAAGNPYTSLSHGELIEVIASIDPEKVPQRAAELKLAIKQRVEAAYLPDGRLIPARLRGVTRTPAPTGTACANHAESSATLCCTRCGSFVCDACAGRGGYCAKCFDVELAKG